MQPLTQDLTDFAKYTPSKYAVSSQCTSENSIEREIDECQKIATSQSIYSKRDINEYQKSLTKLLEPSVLLQMSSIHVTQPDDECYPIAASQGIFYIQLISYNPLLNLSCTNLLCGVSIYAGPVCNGSAIASATCDTNFTLCVDHSNASSW